MTVLSSLSKKKAIAYYRHSAEDKQENSVSIQRDHAHTFANKYNIEIIHEEADEGKSGLSAHREGFQKILNNWVLNESAEHFDYILVYDVSRWGRFQNPDESAMYEFECTKRGKKLVFIDKGMPQEGQALINHLQTSIERYMAADFSRQLSNKVFYGSAKVSEQGYSAGGVAPYGMDRLLLDSNKNPIRVLKTGEHKQISNERVIFVPRNDETTQTVKFIFDLYVFKLKSLEEISDILNAKNILSPSGGMWNMNKVIRILTNQTYIGDRIYNKTWRRLKQKSRKNPKSEWIICKGAFPQIIDEKTFMRAQELLRKDRIFDTSRLSSLSNRVKSEIYKDLDGFISKHKTIDKDTTIIIKRFPIVVGHLIHRNNINHYHFLIKETMRNYSNIICVAIDTNNKGVVCELFTIPTMMFWTNNHLIISEGETDYNNILLPKDKIESALHPILNEMCTLLD